jgi:putative transposase
MKVASRPPSTRYSETANIHARLKAANSSRLISPWAIANSRRSGFKPHSVWHMDEVYLKIGGRMVYLWRAVDAEGEVLDVLVQSKRNRHAVLKLMRKLLKRYAFAPDRLVTDDLRPYG